MMSGGRKPVQEGVRVKLAGGVTWDALAAPPRPNLPPRTVLTVC
jgi:hypothetical protein